MSRRYLILLLVHSLLILQCIGMEHSIDISQEYRREKIPVVIDPRKLENEGQQRANVPPLGQEIEISKELVPSTGGNIEQPPVVIGGEAALETSYLSISQRLYAWLKSLTDKISHVKNKLSSPFIKKWNDFQNELSGTLEAIEQENAVGENEKTLKQLPSELKKAANAIGELQVFDPTAYANAIVYVMEKWLSVYVQNWLGSPLRQQQLEAYNKKWVESRSQNFTLTYSEDPFIIEHFNSQSFKQRLRKDLISYLTAQDMLLMSTVQRDGEIENIINVVGRVGFALSKVRGIDAILSSPMKLENYAPSQIQTLKKNKQGYNDDIVSLYKQLTQQLASWTTNLRQDMLGQAIVHEKQLKDKQQHYNDIQSRYINLSKQAQQLDQELNNVIETL